MPYDPRPISQGGNSSIDEGFSRKAPKGQFRVIGVDTFDGTDWHEADFDALTDAVLCANRLGGAMCKAYVYDDQGRYISQAGTF